VTGSDADTEGGTDADTETGTDADTDGRPDPDAATDGATDTVADGTAEAETGLGAGAGSEAEAGAEDGTGAGGGAAEGETDTVAGGTPGAVADAVGFGVESAPAPTGVPPPVPVPVPLPVLPVLAVPVPGPMLLPGRAGEVGRGNGSDPVRAVVSTRPSEPVGSSAGRCEDPGMRTAIADATGAGPEAGDPSGPRGSRRMRMETADSTRKAIAPADISMTGPVVPAGCLRKTEPACPMLVLTRSANSANASCTTGSRGP
jgi:hypothetical protein